MASFEDGEDVEMKRTQKIENALEVVCFLVFALIGYFSAFLFF
jgi:hypothetical protein